MSVIQSSLTIVFDPPFYKAIFERHSDTNYEVGQVVLGTAQPKTTLIYALIINEWASIKFFKVKDDTDARPIKSINPKRRQRLACKAVKTATGTKAQLILKKEFVKEKAGRKKQQKIAKNKQQQERFACRQAKHLQKHKGH
ncbi:YjdF family protein [Lactobacillus sp. ESL0791]|uniref:YjdF family protein n=1 Tax=Lactobacillus sp. ESL0791 TaxID=2983234 RepID=UPI0023F783F5|nr:YjdF family protein [Lactobacillus sp. ESL0791]MDF7638677.1 YjdF family protein [Lactobacillus sp. ESL0791]